MAYMAMAYSPAFTWRRLQKLLTRYTDISLRDSGIESTGKYDNSSFHLILTPASQI